MKKLQKITKEQKKTNKKNRSSTDQDHYSARHENCVSKPIAAAIDKLIGGKGMGVGVEMRVGWGWGLPYTQDFKTFSLLVCFQ